MESEIIGGVGKTVEIDESKFGKRKYHKGRRVEGQWIMGGIERGDNPGMFFIPVQTRDTLEGIISRHVRPGTRIISDCWKSYNELNLFEGYEHLTINHSKNFVDPNDPDIHTNTIESTWRAVKASLPKSGARKKDYYEYFAEYIFRRKVLRGAPDDFIKFLECIRDIHPPGEPSTVVPVPIYESLEVPTPAIGNKKRSSCDVPSAFKKVPHKKNKTLLSKVSSILGSKTEWLDDECIKLGLDILHEQFPDMLGLEDPILPQFASLENSVDDAVYVIHRPGHWACIGRQSSLVFYIDSLNLKADSSVKARLKQVFGTEEHHCCVVKHPQPNFNDCGVYALFFAYCCCFGMDMRHQVPELNIRNDRMRTHLLQCLHQKQFTMFENQ